LHPIFSYGRRGNPGRAWMLPILKTSVKNTELQHFSDYFLPISERIYQKVLDISEKKTIPIKILETLVEQIWALLPSYCDLPTDLEKVLSHLNNLIKGI
jgi:ribosomal RNA-processing protein 12